MLLRRLAFCSLVLLAAKIATFGHATIVPLGRGDHDVSYSEILRALGRIEGELIQICKLSERVSALEPAQSWLKGGWAILTAAVLQQFVPSNIPSEHPTSLGHLMP